MSTNSKSELNSIICTLQNVINKLSNITDVLNSRCANIGNYECADCVKRVTENYTTIKRNLNNVDTTRTKDESVASSSLYTRVSLRR